MVQLQLPGISGHPFEGRFNLGIHTYIHTLTNFNLLITATTLIVTFNHAKIRKKNVPSVLTFLQYMLYLIVPDAYLLKNTVCFQLYASHLLLHQAVRVYMCDT